MEQAIESNQSSLVPAYIGWVFGTALLAIGIPMAWSLGVLLVALGLVAIGWVTLRAPRQRILGLVALLLGVALGLGLIQLLWEFPPSVQRLPFGS